MTGATSVESGERSPTPGQEKLNRLLIQQFYEDSVHRYGSDSEQAEMLSKLLSPAGPDGAEKAIR